MKVILISGKAQNGKDTAAEMIRAKLESDNHRVIVTHYADLLKYICRNYLGWDGVKDENGRRILQYVGTDVIRKQNPNLWVDFVAMILKYFHENWDYAIIPDCRFENEIDVMKDSFDTVHLRVQRNNYATHLTAEQQKHPSETALDGITPDFCINNDGTLEDLSNAIAVWVKENLYNR